MDIQFPDNVWSLFYSGRAKAVIFAGVRDCGIGPGHAVNATGQSRREAIIVTRVSYTFVETLQPEDAGNCGWLGANEITNELLRQKPDLKGADPVTLVYFERNMKDRG